MPWLDARGRTGEPAVRRLVAEGAESGALPSAAPGGDGDASHAPALALVRIGVKCVIVCRRAELVRALSEDAAVRRSGEDEYGGVSIIVALRTRGVVGAHGDLGERGELKSAEPARKRACWCAPSHGDAVARLKRRAVADWAEIHSTAARRDMTTYCSSPKPPLAKDEANRRRLSA